MEKKPLSRRAFMRAAVGAEPAQISSILARTKPADNAAAAAAIAALPGAEVIWRADDGSKLAVVLETESQAETLRRLQEITAVSGVVTADLTYAYNGGEDHG